MARVMFRPNVRSRIRDMANVYIMIRVRSRFGDIIRVRDHL